MGRALLITLAGVIVALSYTFLGMANRGLTMTRQNVNSYAMTKAKNTAHTGIQIAIQKYNDSNQSWTGPESISYENATISISLKETKTDTIRVTSESSFADARHTVISTFDISQKQSLVPPFASAVSKVGNQPINFDKSGNSKVHFDGHPPDLPDGSPSPCMDKPGLTVDNQDEVVDYEGSSNIDGEPPVAKNDSTTYKDISGLIEELEPHAIPVDDEDSFTSEPQIYFINSYTHLSGQTSGSGILVIRNNATLDIFNTENTELFTSGKFRFDGLVILENGSNFKGRGTADINGSIIAASNTSSSSIDTNGNFTARYDCLAQKFAEKAVNTALNTTIYKQLSIYE